MKSRYSKPFENVQVKIPWDTGMDPYSGLVEYFEAKGVLTKTGNKLEYSSPETGEVIKEFRKFWEANENGCLDQIMNEFGHYEVMEKLGEGITPELNSAEDDPSV
jgi:hypothetical protein